MEAVYDLFHNPILMTSICAWAIAQVIKTIIDFFLSGKLNAERLVGSGGMPSCHSATVCSLATITALIRGLGSFEFALAAVFAVIVMYDARGVRRETGTQARILNEIIEYLSHPEIGKLKRPQFSQDKLKELIGHTPFQVLCGAILGIIIAFVSYFCVIG